ncbi:hypothetical protein [Encephalitozoon cuniculi GB-M1]|uniref:Uncharacterized protein n=2 Tax=Encephalitozoon cuniculi TaxID=6035 RepID=Q8SVK6_ENCCU|nr:uncharacterized protein ECU05_0660 [Encephalitozoon cuniculi GB-M1]AGE95436.1 hypothetical protein ECU05_0660 [Encephalitozoon cuniculi]KMV66122.1 hypothetical protein M970_050640 [Encephalitozoon cuniculi EcunIII-L]UYI27858.1 baculoviral inhibition of apoptosis protein repeat domain-containing protein [Encephalitozoon cuniculi]CAD26585.1 hypothetical protein [Encephalitozoon cuniculi GB-M1]
MFSFKRRMETFAGWPEDYGAATPESLSIAGFMCLSAESDDLTVRCVYCDKTLECWERTDVPAKEHYLHMSVCPLFNVNKVEGRVHMFDGWNPKEARVLARKGFVKYNLGDMDFIFCYKCGSIDRNHVCRRKRGCPYNAEKSSNIFFYDLIGGAYNKELARYTECNLYIPNQLREFLGMVVSDARMSALGSIGDAIDVYVSNKLADMEKAMDNDIEKILGEMAGGIEGKDPERGRCMSLDVLPTTAENSR